MPLILHIETSTRACSVGLSHDGRLLALRESLDSGYSHSSTLTVFMQEVLEQTGHTPGDVSAVAISSGPGSYTGLRIGVSAAKGFCYALDIPLIPVHTMLAMTRVAHEYLSAAKPEVLSRSRNILYCPMIDARRMEVYYALFREDMSLLRDTEAAIIEHASFEALLQEHDLLFFGDGAEKCKAVIRSPRAHFLPDIWPSAKGMVAEAEQKYQQGDFADLAYYEPFYLKDFVAGTPRVKGLK